jgi:hypothetical protein
MKKQPDTITELRDDLLKVYSGLRSGDISPSEAKEVINSSGKIFTSCKVQMEYSKQRGETPSISFIK